ncbi:unnamed protein product [Tenebrio molitor]|nr:unnamed protein product [Tenebrio molitor]
MLTCTNFCLFAINANKDASKFCKIVPCLFYYAPRRAWHN